MAYPAPLSLAVLPLMPAGRSCLGAPFSCSWLDPAAAPLSQASDAELRSALKERGALCLAGRWRLVEAAYLGHVLELLLLTAAEHDWPRSAVPADDMAAHLCRDAEINPRSSTPHPLSSHFLINQDLTHLSPSVEPCNRLDRAH